jgi:hypothetical protein
MGEAKVAAFYDDPVKQACDILCANKAFGLRSYSIDPSLPWAARRWIKFFAQCGRGALRRLTAVQTSPGNGLHEEASGRSADVGAQHAGAQIAPTGAIISGSKT